MLDLDTARRDLSTKTKTQIERETAWTWASRAIIAYDTYVSTSDPAWLIDSVLYAHEAVEHAAEGGVLGDVKAALVHVP